MSKHIPIENTFDLEVACRREERNAPKNWTPEQVKKYIADVRTAWETMSTHEQRLRLLLGRLYRQDGMLFDDIRRPLYVTPFPGAYGLAGYVITLEGSPPKGTIFATSRDSAYFSPDDVVDSHIEYHAHGKTRAIGAKQGASYMRQTPAVQRAMEVSSIVGTFLGMWFIDHPEDSRVGPHARRQAKRAVS